jgi:hypothetical protein
MLPDPAKSRAVIVGSSRYSRLDALPAVSNNVSQMVEVLTDDWLWGLAPEHCVRLLDPEHPAQVLDALAKAAAEASETLVFYFAGHGVLRPDAYDLYLALNDAALQQWWHAVRYDDIRRIMMESPGPTSKVVLLDCCYSGMAMMPGMGGGADIGDRARINGTYLMTASAETSVALAPRGEPLTAFTGALVKAVRSGVPDGPQVLDFNTLYNQVRNALVAAGRPTPQQRSGNGGGRIALVRNVFYRGEHGRGWRGEIQLTNDELQALRLPPGELLDRVAQERLRDEAAADRLLQVVGSRRAEQGVAAVIHHSHPTDDTAEIQAIMSAAAGRPTAELITLIDAFRRTEQEARVNPLLAACAKEPPDRITDLATRLRETGEPAAIVALLGAAVEARIDDLQQLTPMLVSLLDAGLDEQVGMILSDLGRRLAADRTLEFADALRAAGHEQASFSLYDVVVELAAARPVAMAAPLAAVMRRAGREDEGGRLVDRMAVRHSDWADRVDLLEALWTARAPAGTAENLDYLKEGDLLSAVLELYNRGQQEKTRQLMLTALAGRPPPSTARAVVALHEAGLPMEAHSLIEHAAAREAAEVVTLAGMFAGIGQDLYARLIVEKSISVDTLTALPDHLRPYAEHALTRLPEAKVVELAAGLPVEPMTWVLATLAPTVELDLLGRPAFALSLLGLAPPTRSRLCHRFNARVPVPPELIGAAFAVSFAEPAECVDHLLRLSDPASRPALYAALANQSPDDIVQLLEVAPDLLAAVAKSGSPTTQLYLLRWLENRGRATDADRYSAALRDGQPRFRVCALAAALDDEGLHSRAAALLGVQPGTPYEPVDLVVVDRFTATRGRTAADWPGKQVRERAQLPPGTQVHHVVPRHGNSRNTLAVFTGDAFICVLRGGRRVTVRYRDFDTVDITQVGPSDVRLSAGDKVQDLGVRDPELFAVLTGIQREVSAFKTLHAQLALG